MSDDELKKVVRRPPLPAPLSTCGGCQYLKETLVDNEAGGVKGFVYGCKRFDGLAQGLNIPEPKVTSETPACLGFILRSPGSAEKDVSVPVDFYLDTNNPGTLYPQIDTQKFLSILNGLLQVTGKIVASNTGGEYYDPNPDTYGDPAYDVKVKVNEIVEGAVRDVFTQYQTQLQTQIYKSLEQEKREMFLLVSDYVKRSIADLKRELLGNEEEPTTLKEILRDGKPLPEEFKKMFGLE